MYLQKLLAVRKVESLCAEVEREIKKFNKKLDKRFRYENKMKSEHGQEWSKSAAGLKFISKTDKIIESHKKSVLLYHSMIDKMDKYIDESFNKN